MNAESDNTANKRPPGKRRRTADMLAAVAFDLFERDGFDAVTMEQIASTARVARATIYNHFPVKEALLDHYFRCEFEQGVSTLLAEVANRHGLEEQLTCLFDAFSGWAAEKRVYLPHSLDFSLGASRRAIRRPEPNGLQAVFVAILSRAGADGELADGADCRALAEYLEYLYLAATLRWLASEDSSPRAECRRMLELFLRGAMAGKQRQGEASA